MKRIITFLAFYIISAVVQAQDVAYDAKLKYCRAVSEMYQIVSGYRDNYRTTGVGTAQQVLDKIRTLQDYKIVPDKLKKTIVSQLYYDRDFERAGGWQLQQQMLKLCMEGPTDHTLR